MCLLAQVILKGCHESTLYLNVKELKIQTKNPTKVKNGYEYSFPFTIM